jgi:hypothetical protein
LDNRTLAEELVMPVSWCGILTRVRQAHLNEPEAPAIGVGPFMLYRRQSYDASGGHTMFASQTPEDMLLAATIKRSGGRVGVVWTKRMVWFRIYRGYAQLRRFLVRKMRIFSDDNVVELLTAAGGQLLRLVAPLPLAVAGLATQAAAGPSLPWTVYYTAALAAYVTASLSFTRCGEVAYMRPGVAWAHPLGGCLRTLFTLEAVWQALLARPMEWRGRLHANVRARVKSNNPNSQNQR